MAVGSPADHIKSEVLSLKISSLAATTYANRVMLSDNGRACGSATSTRKKREHITTQKLPQALLKRRCHQCVVFLSGSIIFSGSCSCAASNTQPAKFDAPIGTHVWASRRILTERLVLLLRELVASAKHPREPRAFAPSPRQTPAWLR
jgi:hypothetical protein